jgi:hypothetical protein
MRMNSISNIASPVSNKNTDKYYEESKTFDVQFDPNGSVKFNILRFFFQDFLIKNNEKLKIDIALIAVCIDNYSIE